MELLQPCTKPSIKIERPQPRPYHNILPQQHNSSNAEQIIHTYIEYGRKEPGRQNVNFQSFTYVRVLRKFWLHYLWESAFENTKIIYLKTLWWILLLTDVAIGSSKLSLAIPQATGGQQWHCPINCGKILIVRLPINTENIRSYLYIVRLTYLCVTSFYVLLMLLEAMNVKKQVCSAQLFIVQLYPV